MTQPFSQTATMKDWESAGWKIRPYHFSVMEVPPPADYTALRAPAPNAQNPIGGFSLKLSREAGAGQEAAGDAIDILRDEPYILLQPIPVRIKEGEEGGGFVACFQEANIGMSGDSPEEARGNLIADILDAFELLLSEESTLGPEPSRQLAVLRRFLQPL